jgi:sugar lactone lactonase YvrE
VDAATGIITSVAGNGTAGFGGDGGPATSASLDPYGGGNDVALDPAGNLFIADTFNHRIRRVDAATGIITTVAGNGTAGFNGDGIPATSASLYDPYGVAVAVDGSLFIADGSNFRIRRVDAAIRRVAAATGIITTVAGNGICTCCLDGCPGGDPADDFRDGVPATSTSLGGPGGVALDVDGSLFIGDAGNVRIRRVDAATGIITTVAGSGGAYGFVDYGFSGDGGPATSAALGPALGAMAVAFDIDGNLFIADTWNDRIRRVIIPNTPAGSDVSVQPVDATTGTRPVELTFSDVTQAGTSSLTTTSTGPAPPSSFKLGDPATFYELTTTALFSGSITVCIDYSDLTVGDELNLRLFHFEGGAWVDTTVSLDTTNDIICGSATSLSPFAVFESETPLPVADAGPDQTIECSSPAGILVTLDGSSSFDPQGDPLTYTWTGPFPEGGGTVTDVSPTVTLPPGISTVSLSVSDGQGDSISDRVAISVAVQPDGFQPPLSALVPEGMTAPLPNMAFKQGRTLPLKVNLYCGATALGGSDVAPPAVLALWRSGDAVDLETLDLDAGQANDSGVFFRFSEGGHWVYNLSTDGLITGTYEIHLQMADGHIYAAAFVLK